MTLDVTKIDRFTHMPACVIQHDLSQVDYKDYYEIHWQGPNSDFGSFRASRLQDNIGQGKRQVINILKAAYKGIAIKSFDDAVILAKHMGVRIIHIQKYNQYTYLA